MPTPEEILTDALKEQWPDRKIQVLFDALSLGVIATVSWDKEFEEDGVVTKKLVYVSGKYDFLTIMPEEIVSDLVARERLYGPTIVAP